MGTNNTSTHYFCISRISETIQDLLILLFSTPVTDGYSVRMLSRPQGMGVLRFQVSFSNSIDLYKDKI